MDTGETGVAIGFSSARVTVEFAQGGELERIGMPLASLQTLEAYEAEQEDSDGEESESAEASLRGSIDWRKGSKAQVTEFIKNQLVMTLWHLHASCGSGPEVLGFAERGGKPFAKTDIPPLELRLVPYSPVVGTAEPGDGVAHVTATAAVKDSAEIPFYISAAPDLPPERADSPTMLPFWNALRKGPAQGANLAMHIKNVVTPGSVQVKDDASFKASGRRCQVTFKLPIITNPTAMKQGVDLWSSHGF